MSSWFEVTLNHFGIPVPEVFLESGTFRGDGIAKALGYFREIHGVELDPVYHAVTKARFEDMEDVHIHLGDSAEVIRYLSIEEPCLFFLDAHWSGGKTAYGRKSDKGCPILRELDVIGKRPYDDVIVIDDMRLMGKLEWSGEDGTDWPRTEFDFRHATLENMLRAYGKPVKTLWCKDIDRLVLTGDA